MDGASVCRYLQLLGFGQRPEGLDGLRALVRHHLCRVPFENVSKLLWPDRYGRDGLPDLSAFLDGIERHDLGGTCYAVNPFFAQLLGALGFEAALLGADMGAQTNVHTVIRVHLDGVACHVDVGYAAPLWEPIRLDRLPFETAHGAHRYVLDRAPADRLELRQLRAGSGAAVHGYLTRPTPRQHDFFAPHIARSFRRAAEFQRRLRIVRFFGDRSAEIADTTLHLCRRGHHRQVTLTGLAELEDAVADALELPRLPVRAGVRALEARLGRPLFDAAG